MKFFIDWKGLFWLSWCHLISGSCLGSSGKHFGCFRPSSVVCVNAPLNDRPSHPATSRIFSPIGVTPYLSSSGSPKILWKFPRTKKKKIPTGPPGGEILAKFSVRFPPKFLANFRVHVGLCIGGLPVFFLGFFFSFAVASSGVFFVFFIFRDVPVFVREVLCCSVKCWWYVERPSLKKIPSKSASPPRFSS